MAKRRKVVKKSARKATRKRAAVVKGPQPQTFKGEQLIYTATGRLSKPSAAKLAEMGARRCPVLEKVLPMNEENFFRNKSMTGGFSWLSRTGWYAQLVRRFGFTPRAAN